MIPHNLEYRAPQRDSLSHRLTVEEMRREGSRCYREKKFTQAVGYYRECLGSKKSTGLAYTNDVIRFARSVRRSKGNFDHSREKLDVLKHIESGLLYAYSTENKDEILLARILFEKAYFMQSYREYEVAKAAFDEAKDIIGTVFESKPLGVPKDIHIVMKDFKPRKRRLIDELDVDVPQTILEDAKRYKNQDRFLDAIEMCQHLLDLCQLKSIETELNLTRGECIWEIVGCLIKHQNQKHISQDAFFDINFEKILWIERGIVMAGDTMQDFYALSQLYLERAKMYKTMRQTADVQIQDLNDALSMAQLAYKKNFKDHKKTEEDNLSVRLHTTLNMLWNLCQVHNEYADYYHHKTTLDTVEAGEFLQAVNQQLHHLTEELKYINNFEDSYKAYAVVYSESWVQDVDLQRTGLRSESRKSKIEKKILEIKKFKEEQKSA